jgi:uncharacterized membrane protein
MISDMERTRKPDDEHELVVLAAYADLETAKDDFVDLERSLKHGLEVRGAALVSKDAAGKPEVVEAANRHGRLGVGIGAGVGALFGLFAPPWGLSLLVGAATGGLMAAFAEHELRTGLRHEVAQALEAGTAVIVAITYPNGRVPVENTIHHADTFRELPLDASTIKSVEGAIADAMAAIGHRADGSLSTDSSGDSAPQR